MTQPNPKADSQSPAEGLRQIRQQIESLHPKATASDTCTDQIMERVTAYAATVAQDVIGEDEIEYSNLDGDAGYWEKHGRNGLRAKQRDRLAALQGPIQGDSNASEEASSTQ